MNTDEKTRQAIMADRIAGMSLAAIGEKYGVHRNTVYRICNAFKGAKPASHPRSELGREIADNWRERLKTKAIAAVDNGLDYSDDPIRRGNLGVKTLAGLGEFNQPVNVNIGMALVAQTPAEFRDRYFGLDTETPAIPDSTDDSKPDGT